MRDPLGRLFPNLSRPVRVALDWVLTIAAGGLARPLPAGWAPNDGRHCSGRL